MVNQVDIERAVLAARESERKARRERFRSELARMPLSGTQAALLLAYYDADIRSAEAVRFEL